MNTTKRYKKKVKRNTIFEDGLWKIPLTRDQFAIVDEEDARWLSQWKWHIGTKGYAHRTVSFGGKTSHPSMHRTILEYHNTPIDGLSVDHINGNKLDNRKANLRVCTHAQNLCNTKMRKHNTSGYRGVYFNDRRRQQHWFAEIRVNGKKITLGGYYNPHDAARAYNEAAKRYHGAFAQLNEIKDQSALSTIPHWWVSRFYPVNPTDKIIYNDPKLRERDCSFGLVYDVSRTGTIGIKGKRLIDFADKYNDYTILPPIQQKGGAA